MRHLLTYKVTYKLRKGIKKTTFTAATAARNGKVCHSSLGGKPYFKQFGNPYVDMCPCLSAEEAKLWWLLS